MVLTQLEQVIPETTKRARSEESDGRKARGDFVALKFAASLIFWDGSARSTELGEGRAVAVNPKKESGP
jgi:hypothetical protein